MPVEIATPILLGVGVNVVGGQYVDGLPLGVQVDNGIALDPLGQPLGSVRTTADLNNRTVSMQVVPSGWLPTIIAFDPTADARVIVGSPQRFVVRGGSLQIDDASFATGPNSYSGTVLAADYLTPMPDDGNFALAFFTSTYGNCALEYRVRSIAEIPIDIAVDGSWSVEVTVPEIGVEEGPLRVALVYDDVWVGCNDLFSLE